MHIRTWFLKGLTRKFELFIGLTEFSYLNNFTSPVRSPEKIFYEIIVVYIQTLKKTT